MPSMKLTSSAIVLITPDVRQTAAFYHDLLGFRVVEHYDKAEKFAAAYRDSVEILLVEAQHGEVESNRNRYGAGFDAYLVPDTLDGNTEFYEEIVNKGVKIIQPLMYTPYGSMEFAFEDNDGHIIGVGRIKDRDVFTRQ
jgi:catechol 2,3-dioxygenase-like lactoylglutathione lyase family enzyme